MELRVDGKAVFAATGGRDFAADKPVVVMIHGAGMDHVVWALQARSLAFRGRPLFSLLILPSRWQDLPVRCDVFLPQTTINRASLFRVKLVTGRGCEVPDIR